MGRSAQVAEVERQNPVAEANPASFAPDLAQSLHNLSSWLVEAGDVLKLKRNRGQG
jgi:hypothetical protein